MSPTHSTDNWDDVKAAAVEAVGEEIASYIERCGASERPESSLISVLHKVQAQDGYLGAKQLDAVAQLLGVPAATVSGVASFYHFFRLTPRGKYVINVCLGTACYVRGAKAVVEKLTDELGVQMGETTTDGMFTLEASRCLGTCGLAPVVMFNDEVHAQVTADDVPLLIQRYLDREKRS